VVRTITEDSESLDDDDDRQVTEPARPSGSALTHLPGADPTQPPPTANRGACIKLFTIFSYSAGRLHSGKCKATVRCLSV